MRFIHTGLAALAAVMLSAPASAALLGVQFTGDYFLPSSTAPYNQGSCAPSPFTVGAGVDTICQIEGVTQFVTDFGDTSLRVDFLTALQNPTITPQPFSGLVYETSTSLAGAGLTGFTINAATTFGGFDSSRVIFEDGRIGLNLQGLTYTSGDVIALDFQTAGAVPEPATWLMMIVGFGAVGRGLRRFRASRSIPAGRPAA